MTPLRRAAVLACAALLTGLLLPAVWSAPAAGDDGGGLSGTPRSDASALTMGNDHGCAIVSDGSIRCWGRNDDGELGQGNTDDVGDDPGESTVRVDLGPGRTAVALSAGAFHTCAILDTGQVRCWGRGDKGQLAQGSTANVGDDPGETTALVGLGGSGRARSLSSGAFHTCAVRTDNDVVCWGDNIAGQLGQGNTTTIGDTPGETPVTVALGRAAARVAAGHYHTCATLDTGQLRCWGESDHGQLLQGSTSSVGKSAGPTSVLVDTGGRQVLGLDAGGEHMCAIYSDRSLHCWGKSSLGQLGQGRTSAVGDDPGETTAGAVPFGAGRTVRAVSAHSANSCAILDTGQVRCAGENLDGQLGQGNTSRVGDDPGESTVAVDLGEPVRAVAVGGSSVCAVTASGLRCWGQGDEGQLANGSTGTFGDDAGELPRRLPAIDLGGLQVGRDTDGDRIRDAADACRTVAGYRPNGCPEAQLKGKKVDLLTVVSKKKASAKCPAKVTVTVKANSKQGRLTVVKKLKTKKVAAGCSVKGKVRLSAKPKKSAKTKVTITGTKLKKKRLLAVRL
jgi:alpha-tubulin suppressor-like RCC1 family protein